MRERTLAASAGHAAGKRDGRRGAVRDGLDFLGVRVDRGENERGTDVVSPRGSPVEGRVVQTREELMIARRVREALARPPVPA